MIGAEKPNTNFSANDWLSFYGSFLAFIGTAVLGYVAISQTEKANNISGRLLVIEETKHMPIVDIAYGGFIEQNKHRIQLRNTGNTDIRRIAFLNGLNVNDVVDLRVETHTSIECEFISDFSIVAPTKTQDINIKAKGQSKEVLVMEIENIFGGKFFETASFSLVQIEYNSPMCINGQPPVKSTYGIEDIVIDIKPKRSNPNERT